MVFDSAENCSKANRAFSRMVYEKAYGLNLICAFVDVTGDYAVDSKNVYLKSGEIKNRTPQMHPVNALPFSMLDKTTALPITGRYRDVGGMRELSQESLLKRKAYKRVVAQNGYYEKSERILDNLVGGTDDSLLACIYIDGNAMGEHNKTLFYECSSVEKSSYDFCARRLRKNSAELETAFQTKPLDAIKQYIESEYNRLSDGKERKKYWWRIIIGGGDEITIICNAHIALGVVQKYFSAVNGQVSSINSTAFSSCAGIAVFHSHDPFARVYEIAEECCESGKKRN